MVDVLALLMSIAAIVGYHMYLRAKLRSNPLYTVHAVNIAARSAWVKEIGASGKADVLAVQTLRNSVMASSFMASTAILLLIGALSLSSSSDAPSGLWHALNVGGETTGVVIAWKFVCLVLDFFIAFFCFSMAVRFYNHVGYMITLQPAPGHDGVSPALANAYLDRAGLFYLLGIRSFFYSVPLVFWMFGPLFMIAATLGLIAAMYPLDRAPRAPIDQSLARQIATPRDRAAAREGSGE